MRGDANEIITFLHRVPRIFFGSKDFDVHLSVKYLADVAWLPILVVVVILCVQLFFYSYSPCCTCKLRRTVLGYLPSYRVPRILRWENKRAVPLVLLSALILMAMVQSVIMNNNVTNSIHECRNTLIQIDNLVQNLSMQGDTGSEILNSAKQTLIDFQMECPPFTIPPGMIHLDAIGLQINSYQSAVQAGHTQLKSIVSEIQTIEPLRNGGTILIALVLVVAMIAQLQQLAEPKQIQVANTYNEEGVVGDSSPNTVSGDAVDNNNGCNTGNGNHTDGITSNTLGRQLEQCSDSIIALQNESALSTPFLDHDDETSGSSSLPSTVSHRAITIVHVRSCWHIVRTTIRRCTLSIFCILGFVFYYCISVAASDFCISADQILINSAGGAVERSVMRFYQTCEGPNWVALQLNLARDSLGHFSDLIGLFEHSVVDSCPHSIHSFDRLRLELENATRVLDDAHYNLASCNPVHAMYVAMVGHDICTSLVRSTFHMWIVILSAFSFYSLLCIGKSFTSQKLNKARRSPIFRLWVPTVDEQARGAL